MNPMTLSREHYLQLRGSAWAVRICRLLPMEQQILTRAKRGEYIAVQCDSSAAADGLASRLQAGANLAYDAGHSDYDMEIWRADDGSGYMVLVGPAEWRQ